jgi:hypothetical protein
VNTENLLILAKTYPTPSTKYVETTCVAAVNEAGEMRRLYPVPYRFLEREQSFSKWQWITARIDTPRNDSRPESRKVDMDSLVPGERISTGKRRDWEERLGWIKPHLVPSVASLESRRQATKESLGIVRVSRLVKLDITPFPLAERDWSDAERAKLSRDLLQPGLFDDESHPKLRILEKIPYRFHYVFEVETPDGTETCRHLITDWEAGELYRKCVENYGDGWEVKFRQRYETEFSEKDLYFVMGNMHDPAKARVWLIISVVYPPKAEPSTTTLPGLEL